MHGYVYPYGTSKTEGTGCSYNLGENTCIPLLRYKLMSNPFPFVHFGETPHVKNDGQI